MKKLIFYILILSGILSGCAQNHFSIPAENYSEKVKILGVAPIFVDDGSNITHPQKDLLIQLISNLNKKYEPLLVRNLKDTNNYYAVSLQNDDPKELFTMLFARREKRDDADIQYNKYFWNNTEVISYIKKKQIDALMVIVVSGQTRKSNIYSTSLMASLEANYNFLTMTAQIIGDDGEVLWEYPNFRGIIKPYYPLINLQYPDFSESEANISSTTEIRFKSIDGIRRALEQKKSDIIFRETQEPKIYGRVFDEIISLVKLSTVQKKITASTPETPPTSVVPPEVLVPATEKPL